MRTSTITKSLGLLALLGSSASMAATVTIVSSNLAPLVGEQFTVTVKSDVENTLAATMQVFFDPTVQWLSGTEVATGPFSVGNGGDYVKNTAYTSGSVFDVVTNTETPVAVPLYDVAILTFQAVSAGAANIVINDDGGGCCGWFSNPEADFIPVDYVQANVVVASAVPAPATLGLLASGLAGLGLRARRKRAAA